MAIIAVFTDPGKSFLYSGCKELFLEYSYDSLFKGKNNPFKHAENHTGIAETCVG